MHKVKWNSGEIPMVLFSSVFGNDDSSKENPNVGKDLTDEEKNCLGSGSTGGSGGWEPDEDGEIRNTYRSIKDALSIPEGLGMSKMALQGML